MTRMLRLLAGLACGALLAFAASAAPASAPAQVASAASAASAVDADSMRALPLRRDSDTDSTAAQAGLRSFALVIVLGVGAGLAIWSARRGRAPGRAIAGWRRALSADPGTDLRVVGSTRLTARASLHVVRWNGREWLLGCSEAGVTTLAEKPDAREAA